MVRATVARMFFEPFDQSHVFQRMGSILFFMMIYFVYMHYNMADGIILKVFSNNSMFQ